MSARCTGACCRSIYLSHSRQELRSMKDRLQGPNKIQAALIWTLMRPAPGVDPEAWRPMHVCLALAADGCSLAREQRPEMCTTYPYGADKVCISCGAASDAEARGVALARTA